MQLENWNENFLKKICYYIIAKRYANLYLTETKKIDLVINQNI